MNRDLVQGLSDALGFVAGALGGLFLGRALGLDAFAPGYDTASTAGILLCGLGGGLGLHLGRLTRARSDKKQD